MVAVDAALHLPLIGFFLPGPVEFVGTAAALLLAARYYVTKESTLVEDVSKFGDSLPGELPAAGDVATLLQPATNLANSVADVDFDILQVGGFVTPLPSVRLVTWVSDWLLPGVRMVVTPLPAVINWCFY